MSRKADDGQLRASKWSAAAVRYADEERRESVEAIAAELTTFLHSEEYDAAGNLMAASKHGPIFLFAHDKQKYYLGCDNLIAFEDGGSISYEVDIDDFASTIKKAGKSVSTLKVVHHLQRTRRNRRKGSEGVTIPKPRPAYAGLTF